MTTLLAYIDPFTGSLLMQFLAMGFLCVLVFFGKVKAFLLGLFGIKTGVKADLEPADSPTVKFDDSSEEGKKAA